MRIVFAGTPEFSLPTLRALCEAGHELVLVVTQPDRPAGRGRALHSPEVKTAAVSMRLPVFQPADANAPESIALIRHAAPDVLVVQAFGQKLSGELLSVARRGSFNVHASLLPSHRGAAPVNWAILRGEETTGVTIMRMNEQIDAGEILAQESVRIESNWTAGDLAAVLSERGAGLCVRTLEEVEKQSARAVTQDPRKVSLAPRLTKKQGRIPWGKSAREVHNHIRGMTPWPGAVAFIRDGRRGKTVRVTVLASEPTECGVQEQPSGTVLALEEAGLVVRCGEGAVRLTEVKPAGSRRMSAMDFARGHAIGVGMRFTPDE